MGQRGQTRSISSIQSSRLGLYIPYCSRSSSVMHTHFFELNNLIDEGVGVPRLPLPRFVLRGQVRVY